MMVPRLRGRLRAPTGTGGFATVARRPKALHMVCLFNILMYSYIGEVSDVVAWEGKFGAGSGARALFHKFIYDKSLYRFLVPLFVLHILHCAALTKAENSFRRNSGGFVWEVHSTVSLCRYSRLDG